MSFGSMVLPEASESKKDEGDPREVAKVGLGRQFVGCALAEQRNVDSNGGVRG
jgi:hypothetical protein